MNSRQKKRKRIVATYFYRDETGRALYEAVHYEDKSLAMRRPGVYTEYIWNLRGVRRVLYMLPELLKAPKDQWTFVVEGEKDAENLARQGLIATTCCGGGGKWHLTDDSPLHGRKVAILPDNDKLGRKHARAVAKSLYGKAKSLKIVQLPDLPPKGDVSDWLAKGGTKEQLLTLVADAPEFTIETEEEPFVSESELLVRVDRPYGRWAREPLTLGCLVHRV